MEKTADTITPTEISPPQADSAQKPAKKRTWGVQKGQLIGKCRKAVKLAAEHGVDVKEAMILSGYKEPLVSSRVSEMRKKVERYSLQTPQMQKLARDAVKDVLKGKEVTYTVSKAIPGIGVVDMEEKMIPSYSNKLAAAAMVVDRVDPAVKRVDSVQVSVSLDYLPFDLGQYK